MAKDSALLVVDVQNDFCPGGALPVPEGDEVVPVLNRHMRTFERAGLPIIASRDWHPPETRHFRQHGGPWPSHCVRDTPGAELHPDLELPGGTIVVSKGMDPGDHGYSAFEATDESDTDLADVLRSRGVRKLYVGGLATDYCVRASVLDARRAGFETVLLTDAIRGIDVEPGDVDRSIEEMVRAGARTATRETVEEELNEG